MIEIKQVTETFGDCSAYYDVILDKEYTVEEFIEEILKIRSQEWGKFKINTFLNYQEYIEYSHGKQIKNNFSDDILKKNVIAVKAYGGWTQMDYKLII